MAKQSTAEFNSLLVESVEEAMMSILGKTAARTLFLCLETYEGISRNEIPSRLGNLFSVLEECFGAKNGQTLGKAIIGKLYVRLALEFVEKPDQRLIEYVEEAMKELEKR